ncbi:DNA cytosine methyltransferase [Shewanella sp. Iso12]|uniref:DNA cytosine methyltransferase n=1 Tax=Shewanella sp. Iso12 TaxID=1826753 RepID=UPI0014316431|nr:DNA cytosine methyltransferase [Shewanella sp. Iso12]NJI86989.1 hypothetical protein [Shewanella sp. Iso12]
MNIANTVIGLNRGKPRIWVEACLNRYFKPNDILKVEENEARNRLVLSLYNPLDLEAEKEPMRTVRVSKRGNNPLLEVRGEFLDVLFGVGKTIRVVVQPGVITFSVHSSELQKDERLARVKEKILTGSPLSIGSLFSGAGIMDGAVHSGLVAGGLGAKGMLVVEKDKRFINAFYKNQTDIFSDDAVLIHSEIELVEFRSKGFPLDLLMMGIPCDGASLANTTCSEPEFHKLTGDMFFYALQFIQYTQPGIIIIENVPPYQKSTSFAVILSVLKTWGYTVEYLVLSGKKFALEGRERLVCVASTLGLDLGLILNDLPLLGTRHESFACVMEDIPLEDKSWREYEGLVAKELKDSEKGAGWRRVVLDGSETVIPTIRKFCHKAGSTDAFVGNPFNSKTRLINEREHAGCKTVPLKFIDGLSYTAASEALGQGVIFNLFKGLGYVIARKLIALFESEANMEPVVAS